MWRGHDIVRSSLPDHGERGSWRDRSKTDGGRFSLILVGEIRMLGNPVSLSTVGRRAVPEDLLQVCPPFVLSR